MRLGPPPDEPEVPGQFWIDFIRDTAPVFRKPTIEQLGEFIAPTFQALIDGAKYVQPRLTEIVDELEPDVIVEDNVVSFPAIMSTGHPWVRLLSCNPAEIKDARVAPFSSGYAAADRIGVAGVPRGGRRTHREMWTDFDAFCRDAGAGGLAWGEHRAGLHAREPVAQRVLVPGARRTTTRAGAARPDVAPAGFDGPRGGDDRGSCPTRSPSGDGALIYLSLGSLGSADVGLMQRLVDLLGRTDHRVIVSKGPLADEITLHDNMTGEGFLPQPAILPMVDLVITHGGNNTVVESFHHGKPMIVLPLFWDQVDNAQRVRRDRVRDGGSRRTTSRTGSWWARSMRCSPTTPPRAHGGGRDADAGVGRDDPRRGPHRARGGHRRAGGPSAVIGRRPEPPPVTGLDAAATPLLSPAWCRPAEPARSCANQGLARRTEAPATWALPAPLIAACAAAPPDCLMPAGRWPWEVARARNAHGTSTGVTRLALATAATHAGARGLVTRRAARSPLVRRGSLRDNRRHTLRTAPNAASRAPPARWRPP